jgi:glycosyltransferase-like protein
VTDTLKVAVLTYSTKPRGGVVHSLSLAEALASQGVDVHLFGLGPADGAFYRPTTVPFTLFPAPESAETLDDKVFASVDSMSVGLSGWAAGFDILHSQDCISARAATRVRDDGLDTPVVRTVHHVDDFTTQALIDCQRQAILQPDRILVVSTLWQEIMRDEYGRRANIVRNGVDPGRFPPITDDRRSALRAAVSAEDRPVLLSIGGIEPRKGTNELFEALGILKTRGMRPVLVMLGGHSFQDYAAYRDAALARLPELGLELGADIVQAGTVDDVTLGEWYRAADALAFPSVKEGFGLVALEGQAADLPVVASSIPVFAEFLTDGENALLPEVGNPVAIADALERVLTDRDLRSRLVAGGREVVPRFSWSASARQHVEIYADVLAGRTQA